MIPEDITADGCGEPAKSGFTVSPHDTIIFTTMPRGLYVGGEGDVCVEMYDGTVLTFANVPAGVFMPIRVKGVRSTGTTASQIVGLY